ncbi:MAG: UxaA family hydrolase, partial [Cetobacterium sp.]
MKEFIKINERDNVLIVLRDYLKDEKIVLEDKEITILEDVLKGHKIALQDIAQNEDVIKYGMPIGHALSDIKMGEWI